MGARALALCALAMLAGPFAPASATEDTDTPGAGRWEINFGASGQRSVGKWEIAAPDADLNYGWGERMQLVLGVQRLELREDGRAAQSGLGAATVGLKWRFVDQESAGYALALFPSYSWNMSASAERRGLVEPGRTLTLPLIAGIKTGDTGWYAQAGRNLVADGMNEWLAGIKVTNQCSPVVECRVEVQHSLVPRQLGHTEASLGVKWTVADGLVLQGSAGRDIGPASDSKHQLVLKFGIQLLR